MLNDAFSAFQTAAGVAPDKLSLTIRSILFFAGVVWSIWCVRGIIDYSHQHDLHVDKVVTMLVRILFVISVLVILVFVA